MNCFSGQRSFQLSGEGVRVNCFFGSKVIAHCSGEGVRVNRFSGQIKGQKWRENAGLFYRKLALVGIMKEKRI